MTIIAARRRLRRSVTALTGLATAVAAGLMSITTANASTTSEPVVSDDQVADAKLGVVSFLVENLATLLVDGPCPIMPPDELATLAAGYGLTPTASGYRVFANYNETAAVRAATCGVDVEAARADPDAGAPHAIQLAAMTIDGQATFQGLFVNVSGATFSATVEGIGGELGGSCDGTDPMLCAVAWHREGLVISLWLVGPAADVDQGVAEELLVDVVPAALASLATHGESIPGAAPTPQAPADDSTVATPSTGPVRPEPAASSVEPVPMPVPEPVTTSSVPPVPMPVPEPVTTSSVPPMPMPVPVTTS